MSDSQQQPSIPKDTLPERRAFDSLLVNGTH
jgi:hypothetical protein